MPLNYRDYRHAGHGPLAAFYLAHAVWIDVSMAVIGFWVGLTLWRHFHG